MIGRLCRWFNAWQRPCNGFCLSCFRGWPVQEDSWATHDGHTDSRLDQQEEVNKVKKGGTRSKDQALGIQVPSEKVFGVGARRVQVPSEKVRLDP